MATALFVYLSIVFTLPLSCKVYLNSKIPKNLPIILVIVLISLVIGCRYQVGTDWDSYREFYEYVKKYGLSGMGGYADFEPIYYILNWLISLLGLPYQALFAIVMMIHLFLLYNLLSKYPSVLPFGLFFYVTFVFTTTLNIQRQTLAFCIFLFSLRYFVRGSFIKYFLCILIAIGFHYSSAILLFAYLLRFNLFKILNNRFWVFCMYFASFLLFNYLLDLLYYLFDSILSFDKYTRNLQMVGDWNMEVGSGLGILATYIIDCLIIIYSTKLSSLYKEYHFNLLFRLFIVGVLFSNIVGIDVFLSRVPFALESLRFLMLSFLVYYLLHTRITFHYVLGIMLMILPIGMFVVSILNGNSGCSPFQFS